MLTVQIHKIEVVIQLSISIKFERIIFLENTESADIINFDFFFDNFKTLLSNDFVQRRSGPKNLFANVNTTSSDWTDIATI